MEVRRQPPSAPKTGKYSDAECDLWLDTYGTFTDTDKQFGGHWAEMAKVFRRNGFNRLTSSLANHVRTSKSFQQDIIVNKNTFPHIQVPISVWYSTSKV